MSVCCACVAARFTSQRPWSQCGGQCGVECEVYAGGVVGVEERKNRVSTSRRNGGATISSRATLVKLEPQQAISSESNVTVSGREYRYDTCVPQG